MALAYPTDEAEYRRRIRAWTLYDWANSAFATTILAAVLPIYYSTVAGATLSSDAEATSLWSLGLSISLIITAILSPILGTISDIVRGKKKFLAVFVVIGILGTAALVGVGTGDWLLASAVAIIGRIGFTGSITFYDALLQHVARPEDQDVVSARGYAMGYLGGGLLLAINAGMIFALGFETGARLSFVSVAIWWAVFSLPIFLQVPEPASATAKLKSGEGVVRASFARIGATLRDVRRYGELFKFLIAFIIYNDAIGTIIGVAAIYGAELGFDSILLILALLLVQFVGIPFSLIFGRLPDKKNQRRPFFLAFIVFNLVALPVVGILGARLLPQNLTGVILPDYPTVGEAVGTGIYNADTDAVQKTGTWDAWGVALVPPVGDGEFPAIRTLDASGRIDFPFNGQDIVLTYNTNDHFGIWSVLLDGEPLLEEGDDGTMQPVTIDGYNTINRYGLTRDLSIPEAGEHVLSLVNPTGAKNEASSGTGFAIEKIEVLRPVSASSLPTILGVLIGLQLIGLLFAYTVGQRLFAGWVDRLTTKSSILLALVIYGVIAVWGYLINSIFEFWFLAFMVATVQGGSQALSRSLFAAMSPASKSGEFFGLFGVMEKFSSFIGPLIFAFAAATFGSSRPAILALIVFFIAGGYLLTRVNVEEGRRVAQADDAAALNPSA